MRIEGSDHHPAIPAGGQWATLWTGPALDPLGINGALAATPESVASGTHIPVLDSIVAATGNEAAHVDGAAAARVIGFPAQLAGSAVPLAVGTALSFPAPVSGNADTLAGTIGSPIVRWLEAQEIAAANPGLRPGGAMGLTLAGWLQGGWFAAGQYAGSRGDDAVRLHARYVTWTDTALSVEGAAVVPAGGITLVLSDLVSPGAPEL